MKQSVGNKSIYLKDTHKLTCKRTDKSTLKVIRHLGDTKPDIFLLIVNRFGGPGAVRSFVKARVGSDG